MKRLFAFLAVISIAVGILFVLTERQAAAWPWRGGKPSVNGTVAVTEFAVDQIFQRVGTSKSVTFAGTYTGNPDEIQVKVLNAADSSTAVDWTTVSTGPTGGAWSGAMSVPEGGWYTFSVRFRGNTAVTASASQSWGVGVLVAMIGQSNMRNMYAANNTQSLVPDSKVRRFCADAWKALDAVGTTAEGTFGSTNCFSSPRGPGSIILGNQLRTMLTSAGHNVPIGLLEQAIGGTLISTWLTAANGGSATSWNNFIASAAPGVNQSQVGGDFEIAIWLQGESDSNAATSKSTYKSRLDSLWSQLLTQTGRTTSNFKFLIGTIGTLGVSWGTDSSSQAIREGQLEWVTTNAASGVSYLGTTLDGLHSSADDAHVIPASYIRHGRRFAQAVAKALGAASIGAVGPKASSATFSNGSANVTVSVTHSGGTALLDGNGSSAGTGLLGFIVKVNGSPATISSTAFSGGNIVLTLSASLTSSDVVTVQYGYGLNPFGYTFDGGGATDLAILGHIVYDNQSSLIGDTVGFPLQPTVGAITASLV